MFQNVTAKLYPIYDKVSITVCLFVSMRGQKSKEVLFKFLVPLGKNIDCTELESMRIVGMAHYNF
jgi:hypothetical protein